MGLFSKAQADAINKVAQQAQAALQPVTSSKSSSAYEELNSIYAEVEKYFSDSDAICITTKEELHTYVTALIESGFAGIDCETTGLNRQKDYMVGFSLYYPGGVHAYIPLKHRVPIFEDLYKGQMTYEDATIELNRIVEGKTKLIFANADFDLSFFYKDLKVDLCDNFYYDVIQAWRVLKENEPKNDLKTLYNKYVLKGKGDPKRFSDFFSPKLFPYCKPEIAKLYAAYDAKITYELYEWQLPYCTKTSDRCKHHKLEKLSDLIWHVEFPMIVACQKLHRTGFYIDKEVAANIAKRYRDKEAHERKVLQDMVQELLNNTPVILPLTTAKTRPFTSGKEFNPKSQPHVKYLLYDVMGLPKIGDGGTGKAVISELNLPITNQILKVRSLGTLISTFTDKIPKDAWADSRIHAQFKVSGADTGRMSSAEPNLQNVPSGADDIRHMFRATPGYVLLSSDYSAQEPRLTAFVSSGRHLIQAFKEGKDVYASIASMSFNVPYEKCLEFHPETHEYQADGKKRRNEAKTILLGLLYGRSVPSIAEQLYGKRKDMTDEEKLKNAQQIYDSVINSYPDLKNFMKYSEKFVKQHGYTETILGRRRHLPDMLLPEFEFKAMKGYVNPDIDPLDINSLQNKEEIPSRIINQLKAEFSKLKYFGQIARRTKQLYEQKIKVINNRPKINDARRQILNSIIQGSAAELTKMAILRLNADPEWAEIGGRLLIPVHDELIAEVPMEHAEKGGEILSRCMVDAANFLPFPIYCDVETSIYWYGLSYPCPYTKPTSLKDNTEDEIKWIQYHLFALERVWLDVILNEDGSKPRGDAAHGINGIPNESYYKAIEAYKSQYNLTDEEFINHIEKRVIQGTV